jgi:hypothetical protein
MLDSPRQWAADKCVGPSYKCYATGLAVMSGKTYHVRVTTVEALTPRFFHFYIACQVSPAGDWKSFEIAWISVSFSIIPFSSANCKLQVMIILNVAFLWNFFISKEAATAERRYEKERHSVKLHACKLHLVQG